MNSDVSQSIAKKKKKTEGKKETVKENTKTCIEFAILDSDKREKSNVDTLTSRTVYLLHRGGADCYSNRGSSTNNFTCHPFDAS